ncbi:hypothetical protein SODALDRAFT_20386 [Sodiomyces alkalinus F11]|uniref:Vint domain-containing protein n=1 Tax=Sodiomyces alkalinus (strain CBS 110278 / VKM F-3762 / F11) TaxID=1314773 RepID=A0A3N2Q791_SODAK|nr:hypothetical protein SODALDRAFT_20386 [Sodiomyces alkalinus F11]ROT42653.1 hypothetical protein SODALDRAFT_20386 [Sodiomyces alkalinus F11]
MFSRCLDCGAVRFGVADGSDAEGRFHVPTTTTPSSDDSSPATDPELEPTGKARQNAAVTLHPLSSGKDILVKEHKPWVTIEESLGSPFTFTFTPTARPLQHASNACFAGSSPVLLASGRHVPVRWLRRGAVVLTPRGPRRVAAVLITPVRREVMCRVHGVVITPWHPVSPPSLRRHSGRGHGSTSGNSSSRMLAWGKLPPSGWAFPAQVAESAVRYTGCIYSVLLEEDRDPAAHAMLVGGGGGGVWAATLGHGIVAGRDDDVRAHRFFGDYRAIVEEFRRLGVRQGGIVVGDGTRRDPRTGLACGFRRLVGEMPAKAAEIKDRCRQSRWK